MPKVTSDPMDREWALTKVIIDVIAEYGIPKDNEMVHIKIEGVEANDVPLGDWEVSVRRI